jgi:hypothetical protein
VILENRNSWDRLMSDIGTEKEMSLAIFTQQEIRINANYLPNVLPIRSLHN